MGKRGGELRSLSFDTALIPEIVRQMESPVGMESYPVNSRVQHRSIQCNPRQENKEEPLVHSETITLTFPQFPSPSPNSGGQISQGACGGYA
ncbi:Dipeptidase ataJ [Fusarium oxysporum f. sp. albedinis]|nr:Dipeptidase ataJ [Fusarium oxysporum f. sp. albedinis]